MPFLKFFDILPGWVWACIAAGLLLALGGLQLALMHEKLDYTLVKTEYAQYQTAVWQAGVKRLQVADAAEVQRRELDRLRNRAASMEMEKTYAEQKSVAAALVASRTGNDSLRSLIADLTARSTAGGQGDGNPAALRRAEETAATFGSLLESCRREATEDAGDLEGLATQVRGLILRYESLLKNRPQSALGLPPRAPPPSALLLRGTADL